MSHFLLKFNHGVEIGARLAYLGHWRRTYNAQILRIADDEESHRLILEQMLRYHKTESNKIIDNIFRLIGSSVALACKIFPLWSLNLVARSLEMFAVFSYERLATTYPEFKEIFLKMAKAEKRHELYFKDVA